MRAQADAKQRQVVLSADDYGLAPGIGVAIRDLAGAGRLNATSCMTTSPYWSAEAIKLRDIGATGFEVGLHLVLTDQPSLTSLPKLAPEGLLPSVPRLISLAYRRQLDPQEIARELAAQLDSFEAAWGAPPAFLDGHHHVHQLPVIRDVVLELYRSRLAGGWVRRCAQPLAAIFQSRVAVVRASVISALGWTVARRSDVLNVPGNGGFAGVRNFAGERPYGALMRNWLQHAAPGTLIMCHPGLVDDALIAADSLSYPREEEYRFLASDDFPALLRECGVRLAAPSKLYLPAR